MPVVPFASSHDAGDSARDQPATGERAADPLFTADHLQRASQPLFRFDPSWLFLIAGMVTIALTVLIPAQHDLDIALWQRERAATIERHRQERIDRYAAYIKALDSSDESVAMSLAATQLNMTPLNIVPLPGHVSADPTNVSASIFPHLEPDPPTLPGKPVITARSSILARWTTSDHSRLWMLAGGVLCILIGLLPAGKPAAAPASA